MATQINIYQKLTLALTIFISICLSSATEEQRYITKSYFDKYDSMVASKFQDFMDHELGFSSCDNLLNVAVKSAVADRLLIGEGSHRRLSSSIRFSIEPRIVSQMPNHSCRVVIVEKLPHGVFADPFELQDLHGRGVFMDVAVFGDTNLELPSFLSNRSVVEIHMNAGTNVLSGDNNQLDINIELPVHARYQPLDESGYSNVEFDKPDLLMHCIVEPQPNNQSCLFTSTLDRAESKTHVVVWKIPSGMKTHSGFVSAVTFISAILSTLSIVWASISCSSTNLSKSVKQL